MIILETERLLLRHFHVADAESLTAIFGDAEVMRYGPGVQTLAWIQNWLSECLDHYYRTWGFGPWAVVEKNKRAFLGYCGLFFFPEIQGKAEIEIGYRVARPFWRQGYATEAVLAVREYSFTVLSLPRLIAIIDPQNVASIRVAEKAGMRLEKDVMLEGYTYPDRLYSIANPFAGKPG